MAHILAGVHIVLRRAPNGVILRVDVRRPALGHPPIRSVCVTRSPTSTPALEAEPESYRWFHRSRRAHVRWVVCLLLVPLSYVGMMSLVAVVPSSATDGWELGWALLALALLALAVILPVVFLIATFAAWRRLWRSWRRSRGHFTRSERKWIERVRTERDAMSRAERARVTLGSGQQLDVIALPGLLAAEGETFHLTGMCRYRRYYGQDVTYSQSHVAALGRPGFVATAMAASAISNASARSRAASMARAQWREDQWLETVATDRRLFCRTVTNGWLTFDYHGITAFEADPFSQSLSLEFERGVPLWIQGPAVAEISVIILHKRLGAAGVTDHPLFATVHSEHAALEARLAAMEAGRL